MNTHYHTHESIYLWNALEGECILLPFSLELKENGKKLSAIICIRNKKKTKEDYFWVCVYVYYIFGMNEWSNKLTSDQKLKNE